MNEANLSKIEDKNILNKVEEYIAEKSALPNWVTTDKQESLEIFKLDDRRMVKLSNGYYVNNNIVMDNSLGLNYFYGRNGYPKNFDKARELFTKSVKNKEDPDYALYNLGLTYYLGKGGEQNYKEALRLFKKVAERGISVAQFNLGGMYFNGEGVEKRDYDKAKKWFMRCALQGSPEGEYGLGMLYEYGKGVKQNYEKAIERYKKAKEGGYKLGEESLSRVEKKKELLIESDNKEKESKVDSGIKM